MERFNGSSSCRCVFAGLLILLVLFISCNPKPCSAARVLNPGTTNTEFIKTSCDTTMYPKLCISSLSGYASAIQTDPKLLADAALNVSLTNARSTSTMMTELSRSHGMKPREAAAMQDCVETVGDSVDELQRSMAEMGHLGGPNLAFQISNIQTWVSAALTNEDTCMDGFAGKAVDGSIKTTVRARILNLAQLTSNALSFINGLVKTSP
ncbi:PREDICTED: 21 kDa protein-like [Nelumbo nucifera]|uniref:21 kDa protein-like n=1 Tax=Nelumbo nucifera TaxID=4432 RepID=A0A1U7ZX09_NELNU|nr:PREDICTED: 21 kDa protein-like [Nelumbo nucifera]